MAVHRSLEVIGGSHSGGRRSMRTGGRRARRRSNHSAATASTGRRASSGSGTSSGPHEVQSTEARGRMRRPHSRRGSELTRGYPPPSNSAMCGIVGHALARPRSFPTGGRPTRPSRSSSIAGLTTRESSRDRASSSATLVSPSRASSAGISRWPTRRAGCVVLNGEIYNHRELRRELEARGYRIEGESDSAIPAPRLRGMGCGLRGAARRHLRHRAVGQRRAAARARCDRFGVKPLYYAHDGDGLCFGSELKAVAVARSAGARGRSGGPRRLPRLRLRTRPAHHAARHPRPPARHAIDLAGR
jgi:hypothetical protein